MITLDSRTINSDIIFPLLLLSRKIRGAPLYNVWRKVVWNNSLDTEYIETTLGG